MPATAADLPVDLDASILGFFDLEGVSPLHMPSDTCRVQLNRHDFGCISLVCRSWAKVAQQKLFRKVTLRSRQDLAQVLEFASCSYSGIAQYILQFVLEPDGNGTPWIHLLPSMARPQLCSRWRSGGEVVSPFPNCVGFTLMFKDSAAMRRLQRNIHISLPRSIPIFSHGILAVSLNSLKLRGLGDVVSLARQLPQLQYLLCNDITWDVSPSQEPVLDTLVPHRSAVGPTLQTLCTMLNCGEDWAALLLSYALCGRASFPLMAGDLSVMCAIVRLMIDTTTTEEFKIFSVHCTMTPRPRCLLFHLSRPYFRDYVPKVQFMLERVPGSQGCETVTTIVLKFKPTEELAEYEVVLLGAMMSYNWELFDEKTGGLSSLRSVVVGCASLRDLNVFTEHISPRMPKIRDRLKYAVAGNEKCEFWIIYKLSAEGEEPEIVNLYLDKYLYALQ